MDLNHRPPGPALGAQWTFAFCKLLILKNWSGRMDLNHRPPGPEPGALARLRYAPTVYPIYCHTFAAIFSTGKFSDFSPFGPITRILDGSSKPKPAFSAICLRNATFDLILS